MMKIMRTRKGRNGFTLLELLIAVSLLAIGLLAVASMQSVAMNANMVSNRLTVATALAQQVAEDVLSYNISDPRLTTAATNQYPFLIDPATTPPTFNQQITIPGAGTYKATYDVTPNFPVNGSTGTGNTKIVITVSYLSGGVPKDIATYTVYKRVN